MHDRGELERLIKEGRAWVNVGKRIKVGYARK